MRGRLQICDTAQRGGAATKTSNNQQRTPNIQCARLSSYGCWMLDVEGKKSSRPATIPSDTDRVQLCATLNTYRASSPADERCHRPVDHHRSGRKDARPLAVRMAATTAPILEDALVVMGSTAGIGFAIAKALAAEGARVIVHGRTEARVAEAIASIHTYIPSARLEALALDLSKDRDATETTKLCCGLSNRPAGVRSSVDANNPRQHQRPRRPCPWPARAATAAPRPGGSP